jgi:hypothetical protein
VPHPLPRYLNREVTRHGKTVWYVPDARGPRIRIKAPFGTVKRDVRFTPESGHCGM